MIEPTDEMIADAVRDVGIFGHALSESQQRKVVAAVLAIVERDHVVRPRPKKPRQRRVGSLLHDPAALKRQRQLARWQQGHLAKAAGISQSVLCEAEKGTRGISLAALDRVAEVLDCPVSAFGVQL